MSDYEQAAQEAISLLDQAEALHKQAVAACERADELHKQLREKYRAVFGVPETDQMIAALKKWGPKIGTWMGLPAGTAAVVTSMADDGAFSGLFAALGKIIPLIGG